jgi:hypothetical protein
LFFWWFLFSLYASLDLFNTYSFFCSNLWIRSRIPFRMGFLGSSLLPRPANRKGAAWAATLAPDDKTSPVTRITSLKSPPFDFFN